MKTDIYCASSCRDEGDTTQISGGGVYIESIDGYGRHITRSFRYGFGGSDNITASIKAIILGLSSVKTPYRKQHTILHINNELVKNAIDNKSEIDHEAFVELGTWYSFYTNIQVALDNDSEGMSRAKNLAEIGMISQEQHDSGTVI